MKRLSVHDLSIVTKRKQSEVKRKTSLYKLIVLLLENWYLKQNQNIVCLVQIGSTLLDEQYVITNYTRIALHSV